MKKTISIALLLVTSFTGVSAFSQHNIQSANFLANKAVINDNSGNVLAYNLNSNITRREMLKVMMKLSGKNVVDTCVGEFGDMSSSDWGCKYAEAALSEGFIASNATFRPDDNVTQIEALKMIMRAKGIPRDDNEDWRAGYVSKAEKEGLLNESYLDYDLKALRGWIFSTSAKSFDDFKYQASNVEIDPEAEQWLESIFDL